jgi:peptidoglycan-N-acetylglucosamine deacetylase
MLFHYVPRLIQSFFSEYTWHCNRDVNKIYLTFDDGPVPGITDLVLNSLAKRGLKATFFMVGDNVKKYPSLAKEVIQAGNQVGNHTFHHVNGAKVSSDLYLKEIIACENMLNQTLGVENNLFRPPYGRITSKQFSLLQTRYQIIMWDVLSGDFHPKISPNVCLKKCIKFTRNGSIVVFHDQEKTKATLSRMLDSYLDYVNDAGFITDVL